jgi:hypothetical protein
VPESEREEWKWAQGSLVPVLKGQSGQGRGMVANNGAGRPELGCHVAPLQQIVKHVVGAGVAMLGGQNGIFCWDSDPMIYTEVVRLVMLFHLY